MKITLITIFILHILLTILSIKIGEIKSSYYRKKEYLKFLKEKIDEEERYAYALRYNEDAIFKIKYSELIKIRK